MTERSPFRLVFDAAIAEHLAAIDLKYHSLIRAKIRQQLVYEPDHKTRNRKPLRSRLSFGATWELRFGPGNRFRVFYHVDNERREVLVLGIGEKERNRLFIGGKEFEA